jgi:hypothetical protein
MSDYLIFARKTYPQPLELLGQIRVAGEPPNDKPGLVEQSRQQFGVEGWIEMIAIPQTAAIRVIPISNS